MNQSINNQASDIRELSADELDSVTGGSKISLGPFYVEMWNDGAFSIGLKGAGFVLVGGEGIGLCPEKDGTCVTVKL